MPMACHCVTKKDGLMATKWLGYELAILSLLWLGFRLLPQNFFVEHDLHLCLIKLIFERECWGCGTLRAVSQLAYGDWQAAWGFNKLIFLELLALLVANIYWLSKRVCYNGRNKRRKDENATERIENKR